MAIANHGHGAGQSDPTLNNYSSQQINASRSNQE